MLIFAFAACEALRPRFRQPSSLPPPGAFQPANRRACGMVLATLKTEIEKIAEQDFEKMEMKKCVWQTVEGRNYKITVR